MRIGDREIAPAPAQQGPYIIAELGVNHDGLVDRALDLVDLAADGGADAIKLQLFDSDLLLSATAMVADYQIAAGQHDPHLMLNRLQLSEHQLAAVVNKARNRNLHVIITIFSVDLIDVAQSLECDAYKTASPDIINKPLIDALRATGMPLIVSAGASTIDEVAQATCWLDGYPHLFMQCVSAYPTPSQHAALAGRVAMLKVNPNALGYSDHTTATDTGALAVASGACILEKHLTHNRNAQGPDHATSLDPAGFAEYVRLARRAWAMLGPVEKRVLKIEEDVRKASRQSLTTTKALSGGHEISLGDLTVKRPGTGLSPAMYDAVIGRVTTRNIEANVPLVEDDLR